MGIGRQMQKSQQVHCAAEIFTGHKLVGPVSFPYFYLSLLDYFGFFLLFFLFSNSLSGTFKDQFHIQNKFSLLLKDHPEKPAEEQ